MDHALFTPASPPVAAAAAAVVPLRHDLHAHPQLGFQETFASARIAQELTRLGIEHRAGYAGGTGIVGLIRGGADGPCVALRADMDALPITEQTGLPYASVNPGCMHACGHDGHMAVLLGAAAVLQAVRGQLRGSVKLLFQPSEEADNGGARMVDDGALDNPRVAAIFGLHGWPGLKVGTACTRGGVLLAAVDSFSITVTGRGTHGAYPADGIDPVVCAAALVQSLQTVVSREVDPMQGCVLTVAKIEAGSAFNIIPDHATLVGTIRTLSNTTRLRVRAAVERITAGIAAAYRCTPACTFAEGTPATVNTPAMAELIGNVARKVLGPQQFLPAPGPFMWGEDFANYLAHVPGCFFALGVQPHDRDSYPMLHNDRYDFTDAAIAPGIAMMAGAAVAFLSEPAFESHA